LIKSNRTTDPHVLLEGTKIPLNYRFMSSFADYLQAIIEWLIVSIFNGAHSTVWVM